MTASLPLPHDSDSDAAPEQQFAAQSGPRALPAPRKPRPRKPATKAKPKRAAEPAATLVPPPLPPIPADQAAAARAVPAVPAKPAESAAEVAARLAAQVTTTPDGLETAPPVPDTAPAAEVVAEAVPVAEPEAPVTAEPEAEPTETTETAADALEDLGIAPESTSPEPAPIEAESVVVEVEPVEAEPVEVELVIDVESVERVAPVETERAPESEADLVADVAAVAAIVSTLDEEPLDEPATHLPALALRGVTKLFGGTAAVDGIDLTVPAGSFYGLVGPNGAGKTTTLSMIAGLLRPDRGSIRINGVDAASDPAGAKRLMGVLPDRLRTFDRLTGRQLLHYYGLLRGLPAAVADSRAADLARAFDLTDALSRPVSDYSGGMTKKIMLAGALIHSPRVLVLDEPFEAVDPVSSAVILDILGAYVAHGGTVILSSHGMDLVERVCSRVAVIVAGQVLAEGTVDEVRGELTLEQRFVELAGGLSDVEGLEWLHTFSG